MNERRVLVLILIFAALVGAVNNYLYIRAYVVPVWWQASSIVLFVLFMLTWYHYDSVSNGYKRTKWMNAGVLFMAVVAIPFYLVRSRAKGKKIKALLALSGFVALLLLSTIVGGLGGHFIGSSVVTHYSQSTVLPDMLNSPFNTDASRWAT
jgi:hypothetical protein